VPVGLLRGYSCIWIHVSRYNLNNQLSRYNSCARWAPVASTLVHGILVRKLLLHHLNVELVYLFLSLKLAEKRPIYRWKETYILMKRDLYIDETRPMYRWKEAHIQIERDLYTYTKSPTMYIHMKRAQYTMEKRPIYI